MPILKNKIQSKGSLNRKSPPAIACMRSKWPAGTAGFSLIELMVAVSIFLIITSVILFNQNKFSSNILITNIAYQVALSIRQSQVYGSGSKLDTSAVTTRYGYGNHFTVNNSSPGTPGNFIFFADNGGIGSSYAGDYIYDGAATNDKLLDTISFTQGQYVKKICARPIGSLTLDCSSIHFLDIVFVKPNADAYISTDQLSYSISGGARYSEADIMVSSPLGDKCRWIQVFSTGQIAVDQNAPSPTDPSECSVMP